MPVLSIAYNSRNRGKQQLGDGTDGQVTGPLLIFYIAEKHIMSFIVLWIWDLLYIKRCLLYQVGGDWWVTATLQLSLTKY